MRERNDEKKRTPKASALSKIKQGLAGSLAQQKSSSEMQIGSPSEIDFASLPGSAMPTQSSYCQDKKGMMVMEISVESIDPSPFQPRKVFDAKNIEELAESLSEIGQIEPIVVRQVVNNRYQLIAGERRVRATKFLGRKFVNAIIRDDVADETSAMMAMAENIDREDLSDYEIGVAISNISHLFETQKAIADYIGRTRMDLSRYSAFSDLPHWVLSRLDANPRLINRTNALELKKLIANYEQIQKIGENIYKSAIIRAMNLLEKFEINQIKFIPKIKKFVAESSLEETISASEPIQRTFVSEGRRTGKLLFDDRGLNISVKYGFLTNEDVDAIHKIISERIRK